MSRDPNDPLAPFRREPRPIASEPEQKPLTVHEALEENEQLKVINAELLEAVKAAREMFYTLGDRDTQESRDCFALYEMCDAAIAKANPDIAWTPQPSVPERDTDLEPGL